ncbi:SufD family Fe-S cluster assembly protein [Candidatus Parvarchaeota archaeon]|nr:SufD family Fe-S cluster assembly protein [Candidatus Parvarchaeota archaeon]
MNRNMGGALEAFSKRFDVQKGAKVLVDEASLGCGTSVLSTRSFLVGESASSHYNGIFYGFGNARYYFQQDAVHDAQGTENQIFAKGALDGGAVSNFNGLLKISRQAQLSTTDFREKVLMLSDSAQSFSMPSLDVQNNDVSAAHGAAVGQPEEEELFYLKTRGLGEAGAKSIITRGFYQECLARMDKEAGARFVKELNPIIGFVDDIG